MGFYITDEPRNRGPRAAEPPWGPKPVRGPIREVISGYRYYNPDLGRWVNRDPIGEDGGLNVYEFVRNNPISYLDSDGRRPLTAKIALTMSVDRDTDVIDCSGYAKLSGKKCKSCCGWGNSKNDTYPEKAKTVCEGFRDLYTGSVMQDEAACVAKCLIASEQKCQSKSSCGDRNCCRLLAHVKCYASCKFAPIKGLPPGGTEVGLVDLAPSAVICSPLCRTLAIRILPPW